MASDIQTSIATAPTAGVLTSVGTRRARRVTAPRWVAALVLAMTCAAGALAADDKSDAGPAFVFTDVCAESGLKPHLEGALNHAVAWGDADGDGRLDLFLGNFDKGPQPKYGLKEAIRHGIFRQTEAGKFEPWPQPAVERSGRSSGAALADLDNDGDTDLFVGNNNHVRPANTPVKDEPSRLYRNDAGKLIDVTEASGAVPPTAAFARDVGVFDFDNDGLLDLLVLEDRIFRRPGQSRLYRNRGGMRFEDATARAGLPLDLDGFGLAVADLNADRRPDFFVCGANRLFLSNGADHYTEAAAAQREVLDLATSDPEEWQTGAAFGDIDLDGDMDLITAVHKAPSRIRVFLNEGPKGDEPRFRDVTKLLGIPVLPSKAPSCQIEDFDRDGLPDLYWSAWFTDGTARAPFICRGLGVKDGLPRFAVPSVDGIDTGRIRDNLAPDGKRGMVYYVNGPAVDYDTDGDLDFFAGIWPDENSHLFRNDSPAGGHWLSVRVAGRKMNRMGVGGVVKVLDGGRLVGHQEITMNGGYSGSRAPVAYFGLGGRETVDLEIRLPSVPEPIRIEKVKANQVLVVPEPG